MTTLFLACALLGGSLLVLQLALGAFGMDHHGPDFDAHAVDAHGGVAEGFHLFSVRALAAGVAFFGIGGLGASALGAAPWLALLAGLGAGAAAAVSVAALMRSLLRLQADGTVRIEGAVGQAGTVYVRIPARRAGAGKVLLSLQGRTVEYQAVTREEELPTGAPVLVVDVLGPDVVEVTPAPDLRGLLDAHA